MTERRGLSRAFCATWVIVAVISATLGAFDIGWWDVAYVAVVMGIALILELRRVRMDKRLID